MATDHYQKITDQIVRMLSDGVVPWRKPWNASGDLPTSLSTGKHYRGVNLLILGTTAMAFGYGSPLWGTYKQIGERGGQVRKGERATSVVLWKQYEKPNEEGEMMRRFFLTTFSVFNAEQAEWPEGANLPKVADATEHDPIAEAEAIAATYLADGPTFSVGGDRACYSPTFDAVRVPSLSSFDSPEDYYSTLFHELTHSTGHASRLAREGVTEGHAFGDADYSREELIAEMGAAFLCAESGIAPDAHLPNSAAYIASWMRALENDPRLIVDAAGKAQKAADLVLGKGAEAEAEKETTEAA